MTSFIAEWLDEVRRNCATTRLLPDAKAQLLRSIASMLPVSSPRDRIALEELRERINQPGNLEKPTPPGCGTF